ncbi:MAG: methyltransferase domain-containing protein, partial [Paraglaciecola sp.]|nr:methyltransferase domain-containing protein [Paraglaciecola sp.]
MQIYRTAIDDFIIPPDLTYAEIVAKLVQNKTAILFVVGPDFKLIGAITLGDVNTASKGSKPVALDICNKSPLVALASDTDAKISRFMTPKIRCIPLLDDIGLLVEIAWLKESSKKVNLNVGSGGVSIPAFINLDVESDWYKKQHLMSEFVKFDIRNDDLPFELGSVDNIYCSHVIEHIEDKFVRLFLANCYRVLTSNGVLRIACPDA